jgi:hypothetical protein
LDRPRRTSCARCAHSNRTATLPRLPTRPDLQDELRRTYPDSLSIERKAPSKVLVVRRLILAAAALTAALCLLPAASTAGRAERTVVLISRCHTSQLAVSLGHFQAGLGNVGVNVYLRNRSTHTCLVFGYVGFGLRDRHHRRQRSRVQWGNTYFQIDPRPHRVLLRPGARAVTNLAWTANPVPGEPQKGPCEPTSNWLEVTPPDERAHRLVRFGMVVCGHGGLFSTALTAATSRP